MSSNLACISCGSLGLVCQPAPSRGHGDSPPAGKVSGLRMYAARSAHRRKNTKVSVESECYSGDAQVSGRTWERVTLWWAQSSLHSLKRDTWMEDGRSSYLTRSVWTLKSSSFRKSQSSPQLPPLRGNYACPPP